MTVSQMIQWSTAHPMEALGYLAAASLAFASAWAAIKAAYQHVTGRAMPRNAVTTALDVLAELALNIPGALNRLVRARGGESIFAPPQPRATQAPPPPSDPQRGAVRVSVMLSLSGAVIVATLAGALLAGCPGPVVPVDGGPAVTPSSWTSTARVVLTTLRWAVPAARAITDVTVSEPARTQVARALDATAAAAGEMERAVDAYELRGGDRCAAHAAVGGLHRALAGLARVLADSGIALGTTLERVVDGVASIADALVPSCAPDAGWSSAGDRANAELRAIREAHGPLSRALDDLRPVDAGVR